MKIDFRSSWRDWAMFGIRVVIIIGTAAVIFIYNSLVPSPNQLPNAINIDLLIIPIIVSILTTLVYGGVIAVKNLEEYRPYALIIGDWAIATSFGVVSNGDPLILLGIISLLAVAGLLRLELLWGIVQIVGLVIGAFGGAAISLDLNELGRRVEANLFTVPAILVVLFAVMMGVWAYLRDSNKRYETRKREMEIEERMGAIGEMEKRAKAISEMANMLSSTLDFDKVVEAALNIGQSLRARPDQRVVSVVMLFGESGNFLYVETSRGLMHVDESRTLAGRNGIVGKALLEGVPQIGKDAARDPELNGFASFGGIRSMLCIPLRAEYQNWGVLLFGSDRPNVFSTAHLETLAAIGTQVTLALHNAQLYSDLMAEKDRILQLETEGRKELARDIHDHPAQLMAAVSMRMDIIRRYIDKPETALRELADTKEIADEAHKQIRHILTQLYPLALENQGLIAALNLIRNEMKDKHGQEVTMQITPDLETLFNKHQQGVIYSFITEAVTNAAEHAESPIITVTAMPQGREIVIQISDRGKGFDLDAAKRNERGRYGLNNLYRRIESLNGVLDIKSAPGRGTQIVAAIPIYLGTMSHRPGREASHSMLQSQATR